MNPMMILRTLFLVVIVLGLLQLFDVVNSGLDSAWTWVHIVAGLAIIVGAAYVGFQQMNKAPGTPGGAGTVRTIMFSAVGIGLIVALFGFLQLTGNSGLGSIVTWVHLIGGLALIGFVERLWAARTRA